MTRFDQDEEEIALFVASDSQRVARLIHASTAAKARAVARGGRRARGRTVVGRFATGKEASRSAKTGELCCVMATELRKKSVSTCAGTRGSRLRDPALRGG